jgi:hypothetical protein
MKGIELGARFSLATSRLHYCGAEGADRVLYEALVRGRDLEGAAGVLRSFEALMPYLEAIALHTGGDPFDPDVVEAYWIGGEALRGFTREEFRGLLDRLVKRGLPRSVALRLAERLPASPVPHHLFHVSFVGVGEVTGHVETTLANMQACRPGWAEVREVQGDRLSISEPQLELEEEGYRIGPPVVREVVYDPALVPGVRPGKSVALHWDWPVGVLSDEQLTRLKSASERSLEAANDARNSRSAPGVEKL